MANERATPEALTDEHPEPLKIYGLMIAQKSQKAGIDAHCFGDCGKVSMAGGIDDELVGPLFVCCEHDCPWLDKQMDKPYGTTMSFGREHVVYLRTIKQPEAS